MQEDTYYIKEVLKGNKQAYAVLIDRYKNKLFAVILRMVRNPEDAKDLVQDCFIKVYQQLGKYDGSGSFASWLYRVSINHCMDEFRKKKFEVVEFSVEEKIADTDETPDNIYMQKEKYQYLEKLLQLLPNEDRMIILLKYIHDLSYEEISDIVSMPISTVRNKIHRGKKKMRDQHLSKQGGYFYEMY